MTDQRSHPNNPMQGMTLEKILIYLVDEYKWEKLGRYIKIKCFTTDPTIKSCLTFLRKTPWAREKVEALYLNTVKRAASRKRKR
ncbi:MAG: DUF2132 domain-containing protein [Phycisphaerales bacterium]|jgi:uncharacterized protein (DUF2132 family)|nr:DUF2132 domain-containing protein [Phycisphaerales bacterium]